MEKFNTGGTIRLIEPMSKSERFKFGEITLPNASLPSSKDVYDAVKAMGKSGKKIDQQNQITDSVSPSGSESGQAAFLGDAHDEYSYCHFQYQLQTESRTIIAKNTRNHRESGTESAAVCSRVFYFENGQFAVESTRDDVDRRIPEFIGEITNTDTDGGYEFYDTVPIAAERRVWEHDLDNKSDSVDRKDNESGIHSRQQTSIDLTEETAYATSRETSDANQETDIVDEMAKKMHQLGAGTHDDQTGEIFASGTVVTTWSETDWPSDATTERRAETIREKIVPYLRQHS